jgi:Peptidase family M48
MFSLYAASLAILMAGQTDREPLVVSLEDVPRKPLVEILSIGDSAEYSKEEIRALRARIERERDKEIEESRRIEEGWKGKLSIARRDLERLNRQSSEDNEEMDSRRSQLHAEIKALERSVRDKSLERDRMRSSFETELTKLWLAEHWPARRSEILNRINAGQGRDRRHGDVEDVGYRNLSKNPEKEIEAGQQAARQMIAGGWLPFELQDREVQEYVSGVATRVAASSDLKIPLHVTVLDSAEIKAIALPGGFLYLTSGVIRTAQSEAELAGVLSREVARIAAGHATRQSRMAWLSRFFVPVTQIATGIFTGGPANPAAYYGINYGVEGLGGLLGRAMNGTNGRLQQEADQLGVQYAWKAGYDPRGFIAFLDSRTEEQQSHFVPEDPPFHERLLNLFSEIQFMPEQKNPVTGSGEFNRIQRRVP